MATFMRYAYVFVTLTLLTFAFQNCGDGDLGYGSRDFKSGVINEGDIGLSPASLVNIDIDHGKVLSAKIEDGEFIVSFYKGIRSASNEEGVELTYNDHWYFVVNGQDFAWIRDAEECGGPLEPECIFNFGSFRDIDALEFRSGLAVNISLVTVAEDGSHSSKDADPGVQMLIPEWN